MTGHSDELWPFEAARRVLTRHRGWGYFLIVIGAFILLAAAGLRSAVGVVFSLPFIAGGYLVLRRTSIPRDLLPIGGRGGRKYFIGSDGIYRNRELIARWGDVSDVQVVTEHESARTYLSLRGYLASGNMVVDYDVVKEGVIRVYLRDGRTIDVPHVIYQRRSLST